MRVLHVTGDWKWTGPAAPMLQLLLAQCARGTDAQLACPEAPEGAGGGLAAEARRAGVQPRLTLRRGRGAHPWRDECDARRLRALLARERFEVLHAWHTRDHVLAWRAARAERHAGRTRIVRSLAKAEAIASRPWNRWLFGRGADGLLCVSPHSARRNARWCGAGAVAGAFGAVDLERFRPGDEGPLRARLGLSRTHRVVGIAARVQRQRRFDLLLEAAARWMRADPEARLLVLGRGTHLEEVAGRPAGRLGIRERVIFAGYRTADYVDALRAIDIFTLLVPGSDGGCRALLEAAACGVPAVTTGRGALPEIVVHGHTGLVAGESPPALCAAWRALLENPMRRRAMGRAARRRAETHFSPSALAERVERLYLAARAR